MLSTDPNQICSVCGKVIPLSEVKSNTLFEEARCEPCLKQYGPVPLETLKAEIISVHGLKLKEIPTHKWHDLIMLQKKKWTLKLETDERIAGVKKSILNIGRENKIAKINKEAFEKRQKINTEINNLILELERVIHPVRDIERIAGLRGERIPRSSGRG